MISPPAIGFLPEHLIDQIKAGEVIERPGSLIKEILENSIDAGANKLELHIKNNGLDLISLKDNGHGMHLEDLPRAFARHATSKLNRFEDLYHLRSYGFRGEALASIASIAKVQCISYVSESKEGSEIRLEGGATIFHGSRQKSGINHGTELVIQDLFFNTPVRLKFIQSQQTEKQFIRRIVYAFILGQPGVEFHLKIDDEEKEIFLPKPSLKERLQDLLPKGKDLIIYSQRFYENNELDLYLIPSHVKAPLKFQNVYINERFVLDKQLHRVLSNALQLNFGHDDFHYIAFLQLPTEHVDVNVHPNKTSVKCFEISKLMSLLTSTIKEMATQSGLQPTPKQPSPNFLSSEREWGPPTLLQERHEYNVDGHFSPHTLPLENSSTIIWIENYFLHFTGEIWMAISALRLLELYVKTRMNLDTTSIPLLVSEPYSSKNIKPETIEALMKAGIEIETLGKEVLVLRSIPSWMNGFPLKGVISCLLQNLPFSTLPLNQTEWSQSSWETMLHFFPLGDLLERRIALDLKTLLKEKLP